MERGRFRLLKEFRLTNGLLGKYLMGNLIDDEVHTNIAKVMNMDIMANPSLEFSSRGIRTWSHFGSMAKSRTCCLDEGLRDHLFFFLLGRRGGGEGGLVGTVGVGQSL